jgi:DNA-binding NarL/FixJ family response regulator
MPRVLVKSKKTLSAQLLCSAIQADSGITVIHRTDSDEDMLDSVRRNEADLLLLLDDSGSPAEQLAQTITRVCEVRPDAKVIVATDLTDSELVISAFSAGAKGVFSLHGSTVEMLRLCIERVNEGQIWANARELVWVMHALQTARPRKKRPNVVNASGAKLLSQREEDVVGLLIEGLPNREIAKTLNLSEHTIKNYLFRIYDKLGISSRTELLLYVMSPLIREAC